MTNLDPRRYPPVARQTATGTKGTSAGVDVTLDPRARTTVVVGLAGPVLSSVHFLLVYLVTEAGCTGDGPGLDLVDPPVPTVVTLVATAVFAVVCGGSALWAYRRWRPRQQPGATPAYDTLVDRQPLSFVGFLLSLLGLVTVLFVGLPALFLPACGP